MRDRLIHFFQRVGVLKGKILSFLPAPAKKMIVIAVRFLIIAAPGRISSFLYIIGDNTVKYMYFGKSETAVLTKMIFKDIEMKLDVTQKTQRILYLQKEYEPYVLNYIQKNLLKGDVFVDVGANVGIYTLIAAKLIGKGGKVFSFEPEEKNYRALVQNVKRNDFENVTCVQKAVGAQSGNMTLYVNPLNEGGHSLRKLKKYHDDEEVWSREKITQHFPEVQLEESVAVITLDNFLKTVVPAKTPHIIKIDIEGAELSALRGMEKLLGKENAPDLICEISRDGDAILDLLKRYHYKPYTLDIRGNPHVYQKTKQIKVKALLFSKQ